MGGLKDRINEDTKAAMLARDSFLADTLKGLKAAILNQEIASNQREDGLGDQEVEALLVREAKKRQEAAEFYKQGGNEASATKELQEAEVIKKYLPEQMDEAALRELITQTIEDLGVSDVKEMGKVIGSVKAKAGNTVDGALLAKLVKETLS